MALHFPLAALLPAFSPAGGYSESFGNHEGSRSPDALGENPRLSEGWCHKSSRAQRQVRLRTSLSYLSGLSVALKPPDKPAFKARGHCSAGQGRLLPPLNLLLHLLITFGLYQEPVSTHGSVITHIELCELGSACRQIASGCENN